MKICICGWYNWPEFLRAVESCGYVAMIIAHGPEPETSIPSISIPNIGLDYGAYDYYLRTCWDGKSDVLFCHDDTHIYDRDVFNEIANMPMDCVFIFHNTADELNSKGSKPFGTHGRAFKMSSRMIMEMDGFYYDKANTGQNRGDSANNASQIFHDQVMDLRTKGFSVGSGIFSGWRGAWRGNKTYAVGNKS